MQLKLRIIILLMFLSLFFTIVGCRGGGGGGGSDDNDKVDRGTAPSITTAVLYKYVDDTPIETLAFIIGDEANMEVIATDPDLNMDTLYITQYLLPDLDTPYYAPAELILPTQSDADMAYFFIEPLIVDGPAGTWRTCYWIVDKAGNESDEYCLNLVVNNDAAPADAVPQANLSLGLAPEGKGVFDFLNNSIESEAAEER